MTKRQAEEDPEPEDSVHQETLAPEDITHDDQITAEEDPELAPMVSTAELDEGIRIISIFTSHNKSLRYKARTVPKLRKLFQVAGEMVSGPSSSIKRENKRLMKAARKSEDNEKLANTEIRMLRKFRVATNQQTNGGSVPITMPKPGMLMGPGSDVQVKSIAPEDIVVAPYKEKLDSTYISMPKLATEGDRSTYESLTFGRACHICKEQYKLIHPFYDQLCPDCAEFNYAKRHQELDMTGKVAIVTGGRVKIGLCVALKLLRSHCATVIVTTRFPKDAARRFQLEKDYMVWKDHLRIYGLDFRDIPMVHHFCHHIKSNYSRLDFIVNNAAQTVRRPPAYYRHLLADELKDVQGQSIPEIVDYASYQPRDLFVLSKSQNSNDESFANSVARQALNSTQRPAAGSICTSVLLSQVPLINGDEQHNPELFPPGLFDIDLQQVDLRTTNSWTQKLGEISTVELIECHAINSFAPFIINSELKCMMVAHDNETARVKEERLRDGKYIVNVSAMEGQFYRHKTHFHPHTNMAKASLNMLTRTSAQDYFNDGIFMNCVDTGWITDENPHESSKMWSEPPLDEWDAAIRILDPILVGLRDTSNRNYGVFFKNYVPTRW